jgi:hypothetical protein
MPRALEQSVETLLEADRDDNRRHVDLAVSLRLCDVEEDADGRARWKAETDEELIEIGGRWDRRTKRWGGEARRVRVIRVHRGQEAAARWLAEWFERAGQGPKGKHWDRPTKHTPSVAFRRVWSLLLLGGRRGGKSHLSCVALVMFAVMTPRARIWAISPTQEETDELEQALRSLMPRRWYRFRGGGAGKPLQFRLANGARILCLSGHKPRSLKRGRVDFALYNEAQNMYRAGWIQLRGAIADTGGLVVLAANPPDAEIGRWIEDLHERARARKNLVELFELSARNNPFVQFQALADMEADLSDPITFAREVEGKMMPIGDIVFHSWSDSESVKDPPASFVDVTAEVTRRVLGKAAGYVVGMDFQRTPHMSAAAYKFFRDPEADDPSEIIPWIVDECVREDADEYELLDQLEAMPRWQPSGRHEAQRYRGWIEPTDDKASPVHCAVVMDASAWWQDGDHTKGKTSDRALRSRRWTHLYRPQADRSDGTPVRSNPDIVERCKATNAMLKNQAGRRRMFSATHCVRVPRAMKSWPNKNGTPDRRSDFAHVCDAVSYVIYRFFGRPKVKGSKAEFRAMAKFSRRQEFAGY